MKHKQFEEWLQLSIYHELNEQEQALLESHLTVCNQCRKNLEELNRFHKTLASYKPLEIEEFMIQDARRDLRLKINDGATKKSKWSNIADTLDNLFPSPVRLALGGAAMAVIGITIGYFIFKEPAEKKLPLQQASMMEAGESQVTNVRFIDRNSMTGDVEFTFETITPVHIRGNVNEEHVQKVLARALISNQNAGTRLRAVSMIGAQAEQGQDRIPKFGEEVKQALVSALLHDPNLGVRKEALEVLRNYLPDPVVVRAFLQVLANEKNTGLKIAAINSFDLSKYENQPVNTEILEMFRNKAQSDDNNYIRIKARTALQEVQ
ncbi:MAG: hypothetical protein JXA06_05695 [Bacteroidetes bacterium]|nr:hypothetical protein [Bacteroidota bacterium]